MLISELITCLQKLQEEHGDLPVIEWWDVWGGSGDFVEQEASEPMLIERPGETKRISIG